MKSSTLLGRLAISATALVLSASVANATDLFNRGSMKDAPSADRPEFSANVALTTDYVFRGYTQSDEEAALSGGFDASYKMFYAGVWASSIDFGDGSADLEIDLYAGLKHKFDKIEVDVGVIYYAYPDANDAAAEYDLVEFKLGLSGDLTDNIGLSGTVYYTDEGFAKAGPVTTWEGGVSVALGTYSGFSPSFTGTIGYVDVDDNSAASYTYWNAGIEVGLSEKFTLDLRYWDTDVPDAAAKNVADARFVATISSSW